MSDNDKSNFIETTGYCSIKVLEPNFVTILFYILIVSLIGIASLRAPEVIYLQVFIYNRRRYYCLYNDKCTNSKYGVHISIKLLLQIMKIVYQNDQLLIMIQLLYIPQLFQQVCVQEVIQQTFYRYCHYYHFESFFYNISLLIYYVRRQNKLEDLKDQNRNLVKESALMTILQQQIQNQNDQNEIQAKIYKKLYADQCERFPLVFILITLGNFILNEILLLLRSCPYQYLHISFLINNQNRDKGLCEP
ncbi:unnamed protein product [Paramecium pentaurelia]|uniref:Transmembrane protein n=1 Tax=Paramecium pentaurelia TaxID=43138 RepID=A0A8S1SYZ9_9CILI|nr:unnamed protein product [Paramecium pentaurelia]